MTELFSSAVLNSFIEFSRTYSRDLTSSSLDPYRSTGEYLSTSLEEEIIFSEAFRSDNQLPPIISEQVVSQARPSSDSSIFLDFITSAGIELAFTDDISISEEREIFSSSSEVSSFVLSASRVPEVDISALDSSILASMNIPTDRTISVPHIVEPETIYIADEVAEVRKEAVNMARFLRDYFKP